MTYRDREEKMLSRKLSIVTAKDLKDEEFR